MSNYIVATKADLRDIDLVIVNDITDKFTVYPIYKNSKGKHHTGWTEVHENLITRFDLFTIIPTNASTIDEVITLHPELFI